jgi:hypothetical protein
MIQNDDRALFEKAVADKSQTRTWPGVVVDADTTGRTCRVRVGGGVMTCAVAEGQSVEYGRAVTVARLPGSNLPVVIRSSSISPTATGVAVPFSPGEIGPHELFGSMHTGTLDDSQAPQFLKTNGSRPLTGDLAVNEGVTIDGVDIGSPGADLVVNEGHLARAGNRVLLFDAGLNPLAEYAATAAGLDSALAAAGSGDVILLPATSLAGNHTIPAGVRVAGLSRRASILTGQITGSDGASLENCSIARDVDDDTTVKGIINPSEGTFYIVNCDIQCDQHGDTGGAIAVSMENAGNVEARDSVLRAVSQVINTGHGVYRTSGEFRMFGGSITSTTMPFNTNTGCYTSCVAFLSASWSTKVTVAMNARQVAYCLNFDDSSPAWVSLVGNLSLTGTHYLQNIVICPGGDAYLCTTHETDQDNCGVWYCANIFAATKTWTLILSTSTIRSVAGSAGANARSLTLDSNGDVYFNPVMWESTKTRHYWRGRDGALTHYTYSHETSEDGMVAQFGLAQDVSNGVWAGGSYNADSAGHVIDLRTGTINAFVFPCGQRGAFCPSPHYVVCSSGIGGLGFIYPITLGSADYLYSNVYTRMPLSEIAVGATTYLYWIDATSPYNLKCNDTVLGRVNDGVGYDSVGYDGVFGASEAQGSGFWVTPSREILWVAGTDAAKNTHRSIAYSSDNGATWATKDGNWSTLFTEGWAGYNMFTEGVIKQYYISE